MNIIKLYFYIFCLIFLVRVGFKWRDTNFLPQQPEIHFTSPLSDGGFGRSASAFLTLLGEARVEWANLTNVHVIYSYGSVTDSVVMVSNLESWKAEIILSEGTNLLRAAAVSDNGLSSEEVSAVVVYEPALVQSSFENPEGAAFEGFDRDRFLNPNILLYIAMILIDGLAALGIFGMAYRKEFFSPLFWRIFLVPFTVFEVFLMTLANLEGIGWWFFWLSMLAPAPYSVYWYGFKMRWLNRELRLREEN